MRTLVIVFALVLASLSAMPTVVAAQSPPPQAPTDIVVLLDGSIFRGTLVERSPERVVLLLPTGETRAWAPSEVESAGRDQTLGPPAMVQEGVTAAVAPPQMLLHVRTPRPGLTLHLLDASVTVPIRGRVEALRFDAFHPICVAPCDVRIEPGTYTLGISRGDGPAQRAGPPVALRDERWLTLEHDDRSGTRAAGWALVIIGPILGGALGAMAASFGWFEPDLAGGTAVAVGLSGGGVIALIGAVMAATNDHNAVRVRATDPDAVAIERPRDRRRQDVPDAF